MKKNWFQFIFVRRASVIVLLILQLVLLYYIITSTSSYAVWWEEGFSLISILVVCYIITKEESAEYKIMWTVILFSLPLFGGIMYLILSLQTDSVKFKEKWKQADEKRLCVARDFTAEEELKESCDFNASAVNYLCDYLGYEVFKNTKMTYYKCGEESFEPILEALRKAEKYIFLEFFIIDEGVMWNSMLEILNQKAAEGVDVRVIYDDIGCLMRIPKEYDSMLRNNNIKCCTFNRLRPILSSVQNNRDHRKIISVDGSVVFIGGMNLADEYINKITLFGYWKDSVFRLEGDGAIGFTRSFIDMWGRLSGENEDISKYERRPFAGTEAKGYVIPFDESPFDNERTAESLYLSIVNNAQKNVYIYTPYLMVDDIMVNALTFAAKSGVDVRIITPHIADKKVVHATTRSFYAPLIKNGVKLYEYTPGFLHSKLIVADGKFGVVGSINMDFRSFNLHFECGAWICDEKLISEVEEDFLHTVEVSEQIQESGLKKFVFANLFHSFLRLLSPLL